MSIAARGAPAVPDVKSSTASSASSRSTSAGIGSASASRSTGTAPGSSSSASVPGAAQQHPRPRPRSAWPASTDARRQRVQRHCDRAGPEHAEVGGDEADVVVARDRDPVARGRPRAPPAPPAARAVRRLELGERDRPVPSTRATAFGRLVGLAQEQRHQIHGGILAARRPERGISRSVRFLLKDSLRAADAQIVAIAHKRGAWRLHLQTDLTGPGFRYVGTGGVSTDEATFVSEVLMEPASQPAPSTSASAAGAPFSTPRRARPVRTPRVRHRLRPRRFRGRVARSGAYDLEHELQHRRPQDQDEQDCERDRGSGSHRAPPGGGTTVMPEPPCSPSSAAAERRSSATETSP